MKKIFYVTFGQQSPFRNGWVEVSATNEIEARKEVISSIGMKWSSVYDEASFDPRFYPGGKLGLTLEGR